VVYSKHIFKLFFLIFSHSYHTSWY